MRRPVSLLVLFVVNLIITVCSSSSSSLERELKALPSFKKEAGGDSVLHGGLIDALQRWADALEAQIKLLRTEVRNVQSVNLEMTSKLRSLKSENSDLRLQVVSTQQLMAEKEREHSKSLEETESRVREVRQDVRVFSRSFSSFLEHYETSLKETRTNNTMVRAELEWLKGFIKELTASFGPSSVKEIKQRLDNTLTSLATLAEEDKQLGLRIDVLQNNTNALFEASHSNMLQLRNSMTEEQVLMDHKRSITSDLLRLRHETTRNVTLVAKVVQKLEQNLKLETKENAEHIDQVENKVAILKNEMDDQTNAFRQDFVAFRKTIDLAKDKYDELLTITEEIGQRIERHSGVQQNFSTAVINALNEAGVRNTAIETEISDLKSSTMQQNDNFLARVNEINNELNFIESDQKAIKGDVDHVVKGLKELAVQQNNDSLQNKMHVDRLRDQHRLILDEHGDRLTLLSNDTSNMNTALSGLLDFSLAVQTNVSRLLLFAAKNKATIMELKVESAKMHERLNLLADLNHRQDALLDKQVAEDDRLEHVLDMARVDLERLVQAQDELQLTVSDLGVAKDKLRRDVKDLQEQSEKSAMAITTIETRAEETRLSVEEGRRRLSTLTTDVQETKLNLSTESRRLTLTEVNLTRDIDSLDSQIQLLALNSSTLKANLISLGDYINTMAVEVDELENALERQMFNVTTNLQVVKEQVMLTTETLSMDVTTLRLTMADLALRLNESSVMISREQSNLNAFQLATNSSLESLANSALLTKNEFDQELTTVQADLRTLSNSIFDIRASSQDRALLESRFDALKAETNRINADVKAQGSSIDRLLTLSLGSRLTSGLNVSNSMVNTEDKGKKDGVVSRFSCAVTSDELHVSGVITYDVCNVNTDSIMAKSSGHATVLVSGDYFLSFSANLVSVNSQAVWCALYKQPAGNEGWQVLGMINNQMRSSDKLHDRDSSSLSIIADLNEGDRIWVEWRGYGESFLYSNPYRLITFSGFKLP